MTYKLEDLMQVAEKEAVIQFRQWFHKLVPFHYPRHNYFSMYLFF